MMKKICILLLLTNSLHAQDVIRFDGLLAELNKLASSDFVAEIDDIKDRFDSYFRNRSRICQGEFSTLVLGQEESTDKETAKLSRSEIKACLNNLTNERMVYLDALYEKRKKYLLTLHKSQLEQLQKSKDAEVSRWQKLKTSK